MIEIEDDMIQLLISSLEEKRRGAESVRDSAQEEIARYDLKIENLHAQLRGEPSKNTASNTQPNVERAPSGRMKKGQSERLVMEFLRTKGTVGATASEIITATSVTYATLRRVILQLVQATKVYAAGDKFISAEIF